MPKKIATPPDPVLAAAAPKPTRAQTMIDLMRDEDGASIETLADAVGWQAHSVRGFIAGTLKKRTDLVVIRLKTEGPARYRVTKAQ